MALYVPFPRKLLSEQALSTRRHVLKLLQKCFFMGNLIFLKNILASVFALLNKNQSNQLSNTSTHANSIMPIQPSFSSANIDKQLQLYASFVILQYYKLTLSSYFWEICSLETKHIQAIIRVQGI